MPQFDPYDHDPSHWGHSLSQSAELLLGCLDAAQAKSVYEVGAFAGDLTRVLVAWAGEHDARVGAIDPAPQPDLVKLADDKPQLDLIRETSLDALPKIDPPDAIVIDGDHNWWTVHEELRLIGERGGAFPLVLFHDVAWPHARRDDYFDVTQIPEDARRPIAGEQGGIFPGEAGLRPGGGLPYPKSAATEGCERNGVLTAVEDFVKTRDDLRLVVVPVFFGFGVLWATDAPYADRLATLLDPWDRHPLLERLEANRVFHLATEQSLQREVWALQEKVARQEAVLNRLLESSAVSLAEGLSKLRVKAKVAPGSAVISKDEIRRALDGDG